MGVRGIARIVASTSVILGLSVLVFVATGASAQAAPALKLSASKPDPCAIKRGVGTVSNDCALKITGTHWPRSAGVSVVECNPNILSGDPDACESADASDATTGHSGRFTVKGFTVILGPIGDGTCSASTNPSKCYIEASTLGSGGVKETALTPITIPGSRTIYSDDFSGSSLNSSWTVIDRHGEYAQGETECNVPGAVSVAAHILTITTTAQESYCGDYNTDGSVLDAPSWWPYTTGDVQWSTFNFTYGTVTYRAKYPAQSTSLWPAVWFLGSNCQNTNPHTAETGYQTCPPIEQRGSDYREIDTTECYTGGDWCQLALAQPSSFPVCVYPVDTNWHTYTFTWTSTSISMNIDGQPTGCSFSSSQGYIIPSKPMFMLVQTQTGGSGGTPNNAELPATFQVSDITVTQP